MGNLAKNNPNNDPYRQQLTNDNIDNLIDNIESAGCLEKKVFYSKMSRRYFDQIKKRVEERASLIADMPGAQRWQKEVISKFDRCSVPVKGYDYNERTGNLETTTNLQSFRLSSEAAFSGTIETADRAKKLAGYVTSALLVAFVLYGGYELRKALMISFDSFTNYKTTIQQYLNSK